MIGGAAPHIVSVTRMAILILRENIVPFSIAIVGYVTKPLRMARKVPAPERETFRC
jgi:hypothetical protein